MASPAPHPPPPHHHSSAPKQQYYYIIIIGLVLVAVVLIFTNAFTVGCCTWLRRILPGRAAPSLPNELRSDDVRRSVPSHKYKKDEEAADAECAVCLTAFDDGEEVRQLPQCGHSFHAACIDMWFHSHSSCPVCRSIVLPSPSHSTESTPQPSQTNLIAGLDSLGIGFL